MSSGASEFNPFSAVGDAITNFLSQPPEHEEFTKAFGEILHLFSDPNQTGSGEGPTF